MKKVLFLAVAMLAVMTVDLEAGCGGRGGRGLFGRFRAARQSCGSAQAQQSYQQSYSYQYSTAPIVQYQLGGCQSCQQPQVQIVPSQPRSLPQAK